MSELTSSRAVTRTAGKAGAVLSLAKNPSTATQPWMSDYDLHLLHEGTHYESFEKLGAHLAVQNGVSGVQFAVWAPNAKQVSVIGDFNSWNELANPMYCRVEAGIWECFVPNVGAGTLYKYSVHSNHNGYHEAKSDPYAFFCEVAPRTANIVWDIKQYRWHDQEWIASRAERARLDRPLSIYEIHLGSWMRVPEQNNRYLTYRELAEKLPKYVAELGFTHVEFMPIMEHPFSGSWGYQPLNYFAPTSRFGTPDDFMFLVDALHQRNIGVILDWVPAHFPADPHGLAFLDGTHLYEHSDPRKGHHPDWGTKIFNYGRNEVSNFLISNALYWFEKYHIDGLRVDAVASMIYLDYSRKEGEWIPNEHGGRENIEAINFVRRLNEVVYNKHPDVMMIAEESTAWPMVSRPTYLGGLGFGYKWNMGWMNDILYYISRDPVHRSYHHNSLTFGLLYAFHENFILPFSHDEVVHQKGGMYEKMPGDDWQKVANLRLLYAFMYAHPGKKLLFMGTEFGQRREWNHETSLDWHILDWPLHGGLKQMVSDLNGIYKNQPALFENDFDPNGFQWIDCNDHMASVVSFYRRGRRAEDLILTVFNFTPLPRQNYRLGVPEGGYWEELLNTDAAAYSGSGVGNLGGLFADQQPSHGQPFSLNLTIPPLGAIYLKRSAC